jgi:hypothetical protein
MDDPIVDEVRRVRDEHAARFNYDLDAIFRDVKEQEKKSGRKFVSLTLNTTASGQGSQSAGGTIATADNQQSPAAQPSEL